MTTRRDEEDSFMAHLMETPPTLRADPLAMQRHQLQQHYRLQAQTIPEAEAFAQRMVDRFQLEPERGQAGLNLIDVERNQYFIGAAVTPGPPTPEQAQKIIREMLCTQGACSTLITRQAVKGRTVLALNDLHDYPLFSTNDMVTAVGLRTYIGAQVLPPEDIPLGTVYWVDEEPRQWHKRDIEDMKAFAEEGLQIMTRAAER